MVLELVAILAAVIVSFIVSSIISNKIGVSGLRQLAIEMVILSITGLVLIEFSLISPVIAGVAIVASGLVGAAGLLNKKRQSRKARAGDYGDEVKWATELIDDGDQMFILAINALSQTEMKEVGIIAESKEEMRDLTIERFEEKHDEGIPEDFIQ